jgi:hypothetical protein
VLGFEKDLTAGTGWSFSPSKEFKGGLAFGVGLEGKVNSERMKQITLSNPSE